MEDVPNIEQPEKKKRGGQPGPHKRHKYARMTMTCECGCGKTFVPWTHKQRFASKACLIRYRVAIYRQARIQDRTIRA